MSSRYEIHRLNRDNAGLLADADVFDDPVRSEQLALFVEDSQHELVFAILDQTVVGFASGLVVLHPDKLPSFHVNEVGVNEGHRRQGLARLLVKQLFDIARQRDCRDAWVLVDSDNAPARALYVDCGARETVDVVMAEWDALTVSVLPAAPATEP